MQLKLFFYNWTRVASLLLIGGALAWTLKLGVIISTNGRIIDTGAAALLMKIGLLLLIIGSTGIGNRLSHNKALLLRILAILLSPVLIFSLLLLIGMVAVPLFKNTGVWYAQQEAPILIAVIVNFIAGYLLYKKHKPMVSRA
jgi:hypothetical protein